MNDVTSLRHSMRYSCRPEVSQSIPTNFFPYYVFFVAQCSATSSNHTFGGGGGGGVVPRQKFVQFDQLYGEIQYGVLYSDYSQCETVSLYVLHQNTLPKSSKQKMNYAKEYSTAEE